MKIPYELEAKIGQEIENVKLSELREVAKNISNRYMNEKRGGQSLLNKDMEALAYSIIRMPATFCAINKALEETLKRYRPEIYTALDIGAGTGAGEWAILNNVDAKQILCIEREEKMRKLGQKLLSDFKNINWKNQDIVKEKILDTADLVVVSYMINELEESVKEEVIQNILNTFNKIVIFIEPGTPEGFNNIKKIQKMAIEKGLNILAPCTSQEECKLPKEDWCHSVVRVERNKIHKFVKEAEVPYEE